MNDDSISRQAAIDVLCDNCDNVQAVCAHYPCKQYIAIEKLPSVQPEPLTDKEQRIFLAAMTREEKVCKEVDAEMSGEQYEEILVRVCREIVRKVKGALWT